MADDPKISMQSVLVKYLKTPSILWIEWKSKPNGEQYSKICLQYTVSVKEQCETHLWLRDRKVQFDNTSAFWAIIELWQNQFKSLVKWRPRSLAELTKVRWMSCDFLDEVSSCQFADQGSVYLNLLEKLKSLSGSTEDRWIFTSSAYVLQAMPKLSARSLIYSKNKTWRWNAAW